jgi:hypothetical protein
MGFVMIFGALGLMYLAMLIIYNIIKRPWFMIKGFVILMIPPAILVYLVLYSN